MMLTIVVICTGQNEDTHLQLIAQANKQTRLGVCGERVGADGMKRREELFPRGVLADSFDKKKERKVICFSFEIQRNVSTSSGKRSPLSSSGRRGGKRLIELKADI